MASFRKKGSGHEIIFTDRSREPSQVYLYYNSDYSEEEVREIKKRIEEDYRWGLKDPWELSSQEYNPRVKTMIRDVIDHKVHKSEKWSEQTYQNYKPLLRKLGEMYGDKRARDLTQEDLDNFVNQPHLARASRKAYLRLIKSVLSWAEIDAPKPPIRGNKQSKQVVYITEEEVYHLHDTILESVSNQIKAGRVKATGRNSLWLLNLILWSFYSGMRPSEILLLEPSDYDRETKVVHVRQKTKNSTPRSLPIGQVDILQEIMDNMTDPRFREIQSQKRGWKSDRVFGHYDPKRTSRNIKKYIRVAFGPDSKRSTELSWYSCRHGCAVWHLSNRVPIYTVSQWLGHKSVRTTENNYADIISKSMADHIAQAHN